MKKGSFGTYLAMFLVVIGIFYIIGAIGEASEPKCIKAGCSSYSGKSSGSSSAGSTSSLGSSYSHSNTKTTTNSSYSSSYGKNNTSGKNSYDSYDDGYDDIYMNGDYDYDRYNRDSDYADGVDDAMDEFGEDW